MLPASLLWVFHWVKRHYITPKHDSPHNTQCLLEELYTSTSEQLKHTIPATLELTTAFEFHSLSANNRSWSNRELFEMEEVKFVCSIKTFSGLAEQWCSTALPLCWAGQHRLPAKRSTEHKPWGSWPFTHKTHLQHHCTQELPELLTN